MYSNNADPAHLSLNARPFISPQIKSWRAKWFTRPPGNTNIIATSSFSGALFSQRTVVSFDDADEASGGELEQKVTVVVDDSSFRDASVESNYIELQHT